MNTETKMNEAEVAATRYGERMSLCYPMEVDDYKGAFLKGVEWTKEIKDNRDYAIRKGKALEQFEQEFHTRHKDNDLYRHVLELLIRDTDPYEVIERLIEINFEQYSKILELMPFVYPNYYLHLQKKHQNP